VSIIVDERLLSERRSTVKLMVDILRIALNGAGKTEIVYKANLNFKQAQRFLSFLLDKGLLTVVSLHGKRKYRTTQKGRTFIKRYKETLELIS